MGKASSLDISLMLLRELFSSVSMSFDTYASIIFEAFFPPTFLHTTERYLGVMLSRSA